MKNSNNATILIVDDTKTNVDVLVHTLKGQYKLGVALNGKDAVRFATTHHPQLILLDIIMPEMDGFQVCRTLKANPETRGIPIIFITAMDNEIHRRKCIECGGADYITKPFVAAEIKQKIRHHITPA
ncbi:putative two-component system response regulator [Desulfocicer vacuolatum DSM 3385]|uniref:Putative two-component system response regulator n=1 Tax=Desulfocicer vacuolatum DSM 3385 TaxID=1121400 RepID=A0A1W2AZ38_9BACT|nr:response regulator [Desulfocicer vacuolatum]SMC65946.1 putative two-component system response regulator [Desulfocicer vacuolatum DSM 3385]